MIDPKNVFYLETGEYAKIHYYDIFDVQQEIVFSNGYVHWLEDKYKLLIELQAKNV